MIVDAEFRKKIEKCAYEHCLYVVGNKVHFLNVENFSTVQYMNPSVMNSQIKFNELLVKALYNFDNNGVYLDFGVGPGFFELCNNHRKNLELTVSTVEWENQIDCFKSIRDFFNININYECNSIFEENFEIKKCKTYFNYILLQRFFPIYRTDGYERIDFVLNKLTPYGQNALIVESDINWSKSQKEYIKSKAKKIINISGDWNCWVIELKKIYENI